MCICIWFCACVFCFFLPGFRTRHFIMWDKRPPAPVHIAARDSGAHFFRASYILSWLKSSMCLALLRFKVCRTKSHPSAFTFEFCFQYCRCCYFESECPSVDEDLALTFSRREAFPTILQSFWGLATQAHTRIVGTLRRYQSFCVSSYLLFLQVPCHNMMAQGQAFVSSTFRQLLHSTEKRAWLLLKIDTIYLVRLQETGKSSYHIAEPYSSRCLYYTHFVIKLSKTPCGRVPPPPSLRDLSRGTFPKKISKKIFENLETFKQNLNEKCFEKSTKK